MSKKDALQSALSRILKRKGLKNVADLMALDKTSGVFFLQHFILSAMPSFGNPTLIPIV